MVDKIDGVSAKMYVRSLGLVGARPAGVKAVERLENAAENGYLEDYEVEVWGESLCPDEAGRTETGRSILADVKDFHDWAHRKRSSLEPAFRWEKKETVSGATEELRLPVVCLVVYDDDGSIQDIAPRQNRRSGGTKTVHDLFDRLVEGSTQEAVGAEVPNR